MARATLVPLPGGLFCSERGATLSSGALFRVCVRPAKWNRDIVVFIPGYRDPGSAPDLPDDIGDTELTTLVTQLGYAFATTSFRGTGLIEPATWIGGDLVELVHSAKAALAAITGRTTRFVYQTGGSQGGLGTVLALERYPQLFSGGLAACGPIGSYREQIEHIADFRVVFDYFFADVIPGWPVWRQNANGSVVDPTLWDSAQQQSDAAIAHPTHTGRVEQLLSVARASVSAGDPQSVPETVLGLLWYSFRGTNDAMMKLGGVPFDNLARVYTGSADDGALNAGVERFRRTADPARMAALETSGRLLRPLVTIHTSGDPIVPVRQQARYRNKLSWIGRFLHTPITISRYGHCNFTRGELLAGFALLVLKVTGQNLFASAELFTQPQEHAAFVNLSRRYGADPSVRR